MTLKSATEKVFASIPTRINFKSPICFWSLGTSTARTPELVEKLSFNLLFLSESLPSYGKHMTSPSLKISDFLWYEKDPAWIIFGPGGNGHIGSIPSHPLLHPKFSPLDSVGLCQANVSRWRRG